MTAKARKTPKISVLLPVHNSERYLGQSLDSLLKQSLEDFEIIAINDGSTDRSGDILEEYALKDSRVRPVHRPKRGLVATLNEGIDLTEGEWIARMDSDDIAQPYRFELQVAQLLRTGADFCGGGVKCFGAASTEWNYPESNDACSVRLLFSVPFAHPAVIGRTSAFKLLRYDANFEAAEDYDLWQRAWASGYQFTNVENIVLHYRVHKEQISCKRRLEQQNKSDEVRIRHWKNYFSDTDISLADYEVAYLRIDHGSPGLFMGVMVRASLLVPPNAHAIYLTGCLEILKQIVRQDPKAIICWMKVCNAKKVQFWAIKFHGFISLIIHAAFRFDRNNYLLSKVRALRSKIF